MVPSDLISSLALRGHAPHRASRPGAPDASPFGSPKTALCGLGINASQHIASLLTLLTGTVRSYRLFAPPQQPTLSSRPFRNQRSQPGTSRLLQLLSSPVRPSGSTPAPGSPQSRMASSLSARCVSCCQSLGLAPQPPLPFRVFRPSGSKRSAASARPSARLSIPPDLPSLPAALCLFQAFRLRINVPGPLRSRRLAVPQTSWNLLHYALKSFARQRLL